MPVPPSPSSTNATLSPRPLRRRRVTRQAPGKGGGLAGADAYCQSLAATAGAGGKTWRAYLSTNAGAEGGAVNARDCVGNGPWQNFKGDVVATGVDDLHSPNNKITRESAPVADLRPAPR
jgi:hypothetical protein